MEQGEDEVVGSVTSLGGLNLMQGLAARAVSPAADAPILRDRPQPPQAQHAASTVAFAPAAMSVLIEAQEKLSQPVAPLDRQQTARKIDQLIFRIAGASVPMDPAFGVRQLQAARQALSVSPVDLQA
jgi:hypothetical protein